MDSIQKNTQKPVRKPLVVMGILLSLFVMFCIGISVGASSKATSSTSQAPATTADAATSTAATPVVDTPQCTAGLSEVNYQGTCQPVVRGMSCNFIQGETSYTCTVNLYNSTKLLYCTQIGTTANCY